jgi:hypothetical protein
MDQFPLWLFVLTILLINLGVGHWKARALIAAGRISEEERREFTRGAIVASSIYCLLLTAIQFASHANNPFCLTRFPPTGTYGVATWVVMAGGLVLFLKWLWQGTGGDVLARMAPVFTRGSITERTFSVQRVRVFLTSIVLIALLGGIVIQLAVPELRPICHTVPAA